MKETINQPQIDLKTTQAIKNEDGNPRIMAEGFIIRKGNKFLLGTEKDAIIPIPIMYDVNSGKILLEMVPEDIRGEYKEIGFTI